MSAPTRFPTDMKPVEGLPLDRGMSQIPEDFPAPDSRKMPRIVRKRRYEELFRGWFTLAIIDELRHQWTPPPEVQVWLERYLFEDGDKDWHHSGRAKFTIVKPPWFQRPVLMELCRNQKRGYHYKLIMIANEEPEFDSAGVALMPSDISSWMWGHLRGKIGEFRQFTPKDFIDLREIFDLRRSILEMEELMDASENAAIREEDRQMEDYEWDMLDYNFRRIQEAANHGRSSWSFPTVVPHENRERWYIEKRNGFRIRCRKGSRIERELIAEKDVKVEQRIRAFQEEASRRKLLQAAHASMTTGKERSKRTM